MTTLRKFQSAWALALVVLVSVLSLTGASCDKKTNEKPDTTPATEGLESDTPSSEPKAAKKPQSPGPEAPAIFMMTGLKGYTEPCGCTLDIMLGGIDRIVEYVQDARKLYPDSVLIDGGNLFFENANPEQHEIPQEKARVDVIVEGLKRIQPFMTIPGDHDFALGPEFYLEKIDAAGVDVVVSNLKVGDRSFEAMKTYELAEKPVYFVGVADPALYDGIDGVKVSDPEAAVRKALEKIGDVQTIVLVSHGELGFVKMMLQTFPSIDFGLVGKSPRETDQVDTVAENGFTFEPYDQGRYMGILKLYRHEDDSTFVNAREGSKAEIKKIEKQIEHVNSQINRMPPATPGDEPPILKRLRERLASLEDQKARFKNSSIEIPSDGSAFFWRSVPMEPEFARDAEMEQIRDSYNKSLKALNSQIDRAPLPVEEGEAFYVGNQQCSMCHQEAREFWDKTAHGQALKTLVDRDKHFDQSCIGCHVVGYEKPGGSVLGKLQYTVEYKPTEDTPATEIEKDLRNVGCESCHGPGSRHRFAPIGNDGKPQHILSGAGEDTCLQCHVPEHSSRFNYDVYIQQVTGEGHELSTKP